MRMKQVEGADGNRQVLPDDALLMYMRQHPLKDMINSLPNSTPFVFPITAAYVRESDGHARVWALHGIRYLCRI
jgi:hypothetical protein